MAGEKTQKIIDQVPVIDEPYSDNSQGSADIWHWPYGGDVQEGIEAGACPEEEADGVKMTLHPPLPASNRPWVITAYAIVVVPLIAAVAGIFSLARHNLDRFGILALTIPVMLFVAVPAVLAMWGWIRQKPARDKRA